MFLQLKNCVVCSLCIQGTQPVLTGALGLDLRAGAGSPTVAQKEKPLDRVTAGAIPPRRSSYRPLSVYFVR